MTQNKTNSRGTESTALQRFRPDVDGVENTKALQEAVDQGGVVHIRQPGTYRVVATVLIGSNTCLRFDPGVIIQKSEENGPFSHVFLNRGALTRTYDQNITIEGLTLQVNGVDFADWIVFGLRGQLAFFYVRDLRIRGFRCMDVGEYQYCIHICHFEDLLIEDVIIKGDKDGIHLGNGRRFLIRDGVFETFDDAIALNAHDYDTGTPDLGWIESGVVQNCYDLAAPETTGFFARLVAGAWSDWKAGMEVQKSDTVGSAGRLYRVRSEPDGATFRSWTAPSHEQGVETLDGISWVMVQSDVTYTVGVRDIVFRDIFLLKDRVAFSFRLDNDRYSRSYYPGSTVPEPERFLFENVRVLHNGTQDFLTIETPVNSITLSHCVLRENPIRFVLKSDLPDHGLTRLTAIGCLICRPGISDHIVNEVPGKKVSVQEIASTTLQDSAVVP